MDSLRKYNRTLGEGNEVSSCTKVDPGVFLYRGKFKDYFLCGLGYSACKIELVIEVRPAMAVLQYKEKEPTSTRVLSLYSDFKLTKYN